jgi:S-adenosylmethionine synthetase
MKRTHLFTSESVSEGHPDKIADQVSDAILDACLAADPRSRVACDVFTTTGMILIGGEITTNAYVDCQEVVRSLVKDIGYDNSEYGIDYKSMAIMNTIHAQSLDISQAVSGAGLKEYEGQQGAGDQGLMFGFATNETPEYMPMTLVLSHQILERAAKLRKDKTIPWLRPDAKSQVTIEYDGHKPIRIDTVVVSHQHDDHIDYQDIKKTIIEQIIKPVLEPTGLLDDKIKYFINPSGRFVIGGPQGDSGLTGRKIIVDTYGGMGRHGGGAFSGKDPSKVDRSAAYMARYIAKNVVAAGLCDKCEIQLSYAIGVPFPVSIMLETYGTAKIPEETIEKAINTLFDCSPSGIVKTLDLLRPIYLLTAKYGHFGREAKDGFFTWEKLDKVEELKKLLSSA